MGSEVRTSGVGRDDFTDWATTTYTNQTFQPARLINLTKFELNISSRIVQPQNNLEANFWFLF